MFPCAAVCRLLVSHRGSLHVPERMIWAAAWHGRWLGSWHGHVGTNSGLSKNPAVLIRIKTIISLSLLSVFPSIDLPHSLPPCFTSSLFPFSFPPTHLLSSCCLCFTPPFLLFYFPPSKKKVILNLSDLLPSCHFFSFIHLILSKWSLSPVSAPPPKKKESILMSAYIWHTGWSDVLPR